MPGASPMSPRTHRILCRPRPALAVLDVIEDEHLAERARARGSYLMDGLRDLQARYEQIGDVRGLASCAGSSSWRAAKRDGRQMPSARR